jgi:hypothetical protein
MSSFYRRETGLTPRIHPNLIRIYFVSKSASAERRFALEANKFGREGVPCRQTLTPISFPR